MKSLNFEALTPYKPDPILGLAEKVKADNRPEVLDCSIGLLVGSDQTSTKKIWIPKIVEKALSPSILDAYESIAGNKDFLELVTNFLRLEKSLVFQTLGSSQACRLSFELCKALGISKVIVTNPTWPNHLQMIKHLGLNAVQVNHINEAGDINFEAIFEVVRQHSVNEHVALLIHGSCQNPTGLDFDKVQLAQLLKEEPVIPIIDFSYHGLGDEELEAFMLENFNNLPIGFLCYSFSKTAGLYNQRLGCLFVKCPQEKIDLFKGQITTLIRTHNSTPCGAGARIMASVMESEDNLKEWRREVERAKEHLTNLRLSLVSQLPQEISNLLAKQKGLFAFIPKRFLKDSPSKTQEQLIKNNALYSVALEEGLRLNIAGLRSEALALRAGNVLNSYLAT